MDDHSPGSKGEGHNHIVKRLLREAICLSGAVLLSAYLPMTAFADVSETQKKLDAAKEAASQTQDAINENQKGIESLNGQKEDLQGQLGDFNSQMSEITEALNALDTKISSKQSEIDDTKETLADVKKELQEASDALDAAQKKMEEQYSSMKKRVQFIYEKGSGYYLEILLGSSSFGDFLNRESYVKQLAAYDRRQLESFKEAAKTLKEKKAEVEKKESALEEQQKELESEQSDLQGLQAQQQSQQSKVSSLISQTSGSISVTDAQLSDAQKTADALQDQLDTQNQQVSALEKQLAEEKRLQELSDESVWRDISQISFADTDRTLLANLIYCEAGNQPYQGQVAVGAVVINRVMSGAFPSTVSGVIYQSGQFEPVSTGRLAVALASDEATDSCYQAADAAMTGQSPVGNCLFFRTPIPEVTPKYTIGGHIFY